MPNENIDFGNIVLTLILRVDFVLCYWKYKKQTSSWEYLEQVSKNFESHKTHNVIGLVYLLLGFVVHNMSC